MLAVLPLAFVGKFVHAASECVSGSGGYCVNLAAVAQAQGIPGLEFLPATSDFGELISNIYVFGMGLVAISALVVLVAAGVWYMSAGDNAGRAGEAKKWMGNAIFGLVLALLSWLILFTINPNLLKKASLNLQQADTTPKTATETFSSCDVSGLNVICAGQPCPNPPPAGYTCQQKSAACTCIRPPGTNINEPRPIEFGSPLSSPIDIQACKNIGGQAASCKGAAICIPSNGDLSKYCQI